MLSILTKSTAHPSQKLTFILLDSIAAISSFQNALLKTTVFDSTIG